MSMTNLSRRHYLYLNSTKEAKPRLHSRFRGSATEIISLGTVRLYCKKKYALREHIFLNLVMKQHIQMGVLVTVTLHANTYSCNCNSD